MFVEEEVTKVFQGADYQTTEPDLHKLIKHLKNNLPEASLIKYSEVFIYITP